ncbi:hypothetical protein F5878DRAFT_663927 [Lentinula raphanica]|uniref:Uncharacterized protein n=1 Tax=Lentinula raphanica TaxID=153919 RepID=A0AA38UAE5_9AGAR|nr:hypothetical protein F5878DRAFT_663927 [Lentinula raphanica]
MLLNFYEVLPKFLVCLREDQFFDHATDTSKDRARGYHHTYTDSHDIDIALLAVFLSNNEIEAAAMQAYGEAESLFVFLGVSPIQLHPNAPNTLPMISDCEEERHESLHQEVCCMLDTLESTLSSSNSVHHEERTMKLHLAHISLEVDELIKIQSKPEYSEAQWVKNLVQDGNHVKRMLQEARLNPVNIHKPNQSLPAISKNSRLPGVSRVFSVFGVS